MKALVKGDSRDAAKIRERLGALLVGLHLRDPGKDEKTPAERHIRQIVDAWGGAELPLILLYHGQVPWTEFQRKGLSFQQAWFKSWIFRPLMERLPWEQFWDDSDLVRILSLYREGRSSRGVPGPSQAHVWLHGRDDALLEAFRENPIVSSHQSFLHAPAGMPAWKTVWDRDQLLRAGEEVLLWWRYTLVLILLGMAIERFGPIDVRGALDEALHKFRTAGSGTSGIGKEPPRGPISEGGDPLTGFGLLSDCLECIREIFIAVKDLHMLGHEIRCNRASRIRNVWGDFLDGRFPEVFARAYFASLLREVGLSKSTSPLGLYSVLASSEMRGWVGDAPDEETHVGRVESSLKEFRKLTKRLGIHPPV